MGTVAVYLNSSDKTSNLKVPHIITLTESLNKSANCNLIFDETVNVGINTLTKLYYNSHLIFGGFVSRSRKNLLSPDLYEQEVAAMGYYRIGQFYPNGRTYPTVEDENDDEGYILSRVIVGTGIHYSTSYVTASEPLPGFYFEDIGVIDGINMVAAEYPRQLWEEESQYAGRIWWIDHSGWIHYHDWLKASWETASYTLSDSPNLSTSFPYKNLKYGQEDNGVVFYTKAFYDQPIYVGGLTCWKEGFHIGQKLKITNTKLGWLEAEFLITEVRTTITNGVAEFSIEFESYLDPVYTHYIVPPPASLVITTYIPTVTVV